VSRSRSYGADRFAAGKNRFPRLRRPAVKNDPDHSRARGAAMLHPRHHLLTDITALVEIDAVQPIHIGFMRKCVAIDEVQPAARNAQCDAMGVVGRAVG
jgi:hypothetical protein